LTGSAGSISIFKKIQNGVVLVKKSQRIATGFLTGFCWVNRVTGSTRRVSWVTPGYGLYNFFINLTRFQPRVRPGFKTL
jgi:hypothetical protein